MNVFFTFQCHNPRLFNLQSILTNINLDEYCAEDVGDIVIKIERSFAIEFDKEAFINVKTFGDLIDVVESYIKYDEKQDCTQQQAFYKIREAICGTLQIDRKLINLDSKLVDLFPKQKRRQHIKVFERQLGIKLKILTYSQWLSLIFNVGLLCSFFAFFFDWKIAVEGTIFFCISLFVADKLGKEFTVETLRDLAKKAVTEHYMDMRRNKNTVNREEILDTIKEAFQEGLNIDKKNLVKKARSNWAILIPLWFATFSPNPSSLFL